MKNSTNVTAENKKQGERPVFFCLFFGGRPCGILRENLDGKTGKTVFTMGGQAVIEGVMMRVPEVPSPACARLPGRFLSGGKRRSFRRADDAGPVSLCCAACRRFMNRSCAACGLSCFPPARLARTRNRLPGKRRRRCFWRSLRRVWEYHGAEHKAIRCLEKRLPLTTANVRAQSRLHPRRGTNFLMMVMLPGRFAFSFFGGPPFYARVLLRLALLPVIAGLACEWMRFAADSGSPLVRALNRPGLWIELLTTREPHDDQMEVAAAALRGAAGLADAAAARAE